MGLKVKQKIALGALDLKGQFRSLFQVKGVVCERIGVGHEA